MILKITLEIEMDENLWGESEEDKKYIEEDVLVTTGDLILHTNDIGDAVGSIKAITDVQWL